MTNLIALLENFWILKERNKELYYELKNLNKDTKDFIREKLGYNLVVNQHLVKLEKVPAIPRVWMGARNFTEVRDYVFLCLVLSFLEDKNRDEQFLLSHITEYIQINYPDEDVDWTLYSNRKSLVRVLNFITYMGFIKIDDGNQEGFSESYEIEVLYESTGLSRYFIRNFAKDYTNFNSYHEILEGEWISGTTDRGIIRRMRAYRSLILDTVVYDDDESLFMYIKNFRNILRKDFDEYLGSELHMYKNCAFIIVDDNYFKDSFPENKNICDVALVFSTEIIRMLKKEKLRINPDDTVDIDIEEFNTILQLGIDKYKSLWNKEFREKSFEKTKEELIEYLKLNNMLRKYGNKFRIMSLVLRFAGEYPEDFPVEG